MGKGKNKLEKFAEFDSFDNTFDYNDETKGRWNEIFGNNHPIVVEFACGKGEYSIGLAKLHPHLNFIGVDIKGNRLWKGAKIAKEQGLNNVRFLRIQIDNAAAYFDTKEIHEAWITFPDPQPQKRYKRLCSGKFLNIYRQFIGENGRLNIKTDSDLFYETALEQAVIDGLNVEYNINDVYGLDSLPAELNIQTFYEGMWLKEGKKIKYVRLQLGAKPSNETKRLELPAGTALPPLSQNVQFDYGE